MSEDYTFLRNDQLKIMEDTLKSYKTHIDFLQDTIATLDYKLDKAEKEIQTHKRAFSHYLNENGVISTPKRVRIIEKYLQKAREE